MDPKKVTAAAATGNVGGLGMFAFLPEPYNFAGAIIMMVANGLWGWASAKL